MQLHNILQKLFAKQTTLNQRLETIAKIFVDFDPAIYTNYSNKDLVYLSESLINDSYFSNQPYINLMVNTDSTPSRSGFSAGAINQLGIQIFLTYLSYFTEKYKTPIYLESSCSIPWASSNCSKHSRNLLLPHYTGPASPGALPLVLFSMGGPIQKATCIGWLHWSLYMLALASKKAPDEVKSWAEEIQKNSTGKLASIQLNTPELLDTYLLDTLWDSLSILMIPGTTLPLWNLIIHPVISLNNNILTLSGPTSTKVEYSSISGKKSMLIVNDDPRYATGIGVFLPPKIKIFNYTITGGDDNAAR